MWDFQDRLINSKSSTVFYLLNRNPIHSFVFVQRLQVCTRACCKVEAQATSSCEIAAPPARSAAQVSIKWDVVDPSKQLMISQIPLVHQVPRLQALLKQRSTGSNLLLQISRQLVVPGAPASTALAKSCPKVHKQYRTQKPRPLDMQALALLMQGSPLRARRMRLGLASLQPARPRAAQQQRQNLLSAEQNIQLLHTHLTNPATFL